MEYIPYLFALVIIILLIWMFCWPMGGTAKSVILPTPVVVPAPAAVAPAAAPAASASTEQMIAASTIGRFSRGYNGTNYGGGYDDAMHQLNEAETMSLANVDVGTRTL